LVRLQAGPISAAELVSCVTAEDDGAIVLFLGSVRRHNRGREVLHLEYFTYQEMALKELRRIEDEARACLGCSSVAIFHRTGRVEVGETSVGVAVSSVHREQALQGCRFLIDGLKKNVPIWKKEFYSGGSFWVGSGG
jgi:molybdopterin synthase catalytic subunit